MPDYFRVIAIDFDGTLTTRDRPADDVLAALGCTRADGRRLILVTGRRIEHLRQGFTDVADWFDAIVAENGAVIHTPLGTRCLAEPIAPAVAEALEDLGAVVERGQVIVGCDIHHEHAALDVIRRIGADYQLVRNRGALMIIPAGVTKATGLLEALDELGLSPHSAIGIGDAENDYTLLERCEIGVAVANAVDGLKRAADLVTEAPDGGGVVEVLDGGLVHGTQRLHPARWRIPIGTHRDGTPATIPASQVNVLITGGTQAGKSYLAGLIAERLVQLAYTVVVIDAEGDHTNLAQLHDVVHLGGLEPLPSASILRSLLSHHGTSIVADLSQLTRSQRQHWYDDTPPRIADLRAADGLPHWVIIDEAHESVGRASASRHLFTPNRKGHCLVTYQPMELCTDAHDSLDYLIALTPTDLDSDDPVVAAVAAFTEMDTSQVVAAFETLEPGAALLVAADDPHSLRPFTLGPRLTTHVRHWHKYAAVDLPSPRRFTFRRDPDHATGQVAANLRDFHHVLEHCDPAVIDHHAASGDFSRWVRAAIRDDRLAAALDRIEADHAEATAASVERARRQLRAAIEQRYPA